MILFREALDKQRKQLPRPSEEDKYMGFRCNECAGTLLEPSYRHGILSLACPDHGILDSFAIMSHEHADENWIAEQAEEREDLVQHGMLPQMRMPDDDGNWVVRPPTHALFDPIAGEWQAVGHFRGNWRYRKIFVGQKGIVFTKKPPGLVKLE